MIRPTVRFGAIGSILLGLLVACAPGSTRAPVALRSPSATTVVGLSPTTVVAPPPTPVPSSNSISASDATAYFKDFAKQHPDAAWPRWFADNQLGWGAVGLDGGGTEALVGTEGTISPIANNLGVAFWLRNDQTGQVLVPQVKDVSQSLAGDQRPLVTSRWTEEGFSVEQTVFGASTGRNPIAPAAGDDSLVVASIKVTNTGPPRPLTALLVVRPFGPAGDVSPISQVATTPSAVAVNGDLAVVAATPAGWAGALNESAIDASIVARGQGRPTGTSASSAHGLAEAMLGYPSTLATGQSVTYRFVMPMTVRTPSVDVVNRLAKLDLASLQVQVDEAWQERLHQVEFSVGDRTVTDAFYASLAYILMARQGDQLYSGPLVEHAFWVRDAAYFTVALDYTGQHGLVDQILRGMIKAQLPNGRFPPILEPSGQPRLPLKTEWDSQGEVIFALVEHARITHDTAFLREVYPNIQRAAAFQRDQLQQTRTSALQGTPYYGILPAGESAEDLLDPTWHHYWDDFWAMAGFQEAADAAQQLGHDDDAAWMRQSEDELRQSVLAGVDQVKTADGKPFIPNGPEDTHSTAMARSGTPALWPVEVLDPRSELVQHTFEAYFQWTISPYGGGYRHYGDNDWPYAGLSLAHAMYRLGMMDHVWTILQWTFAHQTAPHLYAWAEAVSPTTHSFASGDMPHSWAAAEMILLLRDMFVRESGDQIAIGPFPDAWLAPGQQALIKNFPTALGPVTYQMTRSADGKKIAISFEGESPPGGYLITAPSPLQIQQVEVDGKSAAFNPGAAVPIPAGARNVVLTVGS